MIVVVECPNIGDALCAIPAVLRLADRAPDKPLYVHWRNEAVGAICAARSNIRPIWDIPPGTHGDKIATVKIWCAEDVHPTVQVARLAGLTVVGDDPLDIEVDVPPPAQKSRRTRAVVVAPFARDPARAIPLPLALAVAVRIRDLGACARVLGTDGEVHRPTTVASGIFGYPGFAESWPADSLSDTIAGFRAARLVITGDSAPNRLAHAAGIGNRHIIITSKVASERWVGHPGAAIFWTDEVLRCPDLLMEEVEKRLAPAAA